MTQSRKYHKTNFRERMTQTQHSLCNGRTFTRQTHVDLGLLRTEVPLHAGVRIGVEGDLDDAVLHGCHRRHLVRIVARHGRAAEPRGLSKDNSYITFLSYRLWHSPVLNQKDGCSLEGFVTITCCIEVSIKYQSRNCQIFSFDMNSLLYY